MYRDPEDGPAKLEAKLAWPLLLALALLALEVVFTCKTTRALALCLSLGRLPCCVVSTSYEESEVEGLERTSRPGLWQLEQGHETMRQSAIVIDEARQPTSVRYSLHASMYEAIRARRGIRKRTPTLMMPMDIELGIVRRCVHRPALVALSFIFERPCGKVNTQAIGCFSVAAERKRTGTDHVLPGTD